MSQHNDILKWQIADGIIDGLSTARIVERIESILDSLEWDEVTINAVARGALNVAYGMRMQKDGLYGVTHAQLDNFMKEITLEYGLNPVGFN
jgi:hypothetical protein